MPVTLQPSGVAFPRYQNGDERVFADRVEHVDGDTLLLESGARVAATEALLATGPARTGDYFLTTFEDEGRLMAGADFVTQWVKIPHAYDVPAVSADEQPGSRPGEPTSGSPDAQAEFGEGASHATAGETAKQPPVVV